MLVLCPHLDILALEKGFIAPNSLKVVWLVETKLNGFCDVLEDGFFFGTLYAKSYKTLFEHDEGSDKLGDIQKS